MDTATVALKWTHQTVGIDKLGMEGAGCKMVIETKVFKWQPI